MKNTLLFVFLVFHLASPGQNKDPNAILSAIKAKYAVIRDYTANATISVDVSFLKIPDKQAKLYYKYPGKVHIEAPGFVLLPKRVTSFNPWEVIGENYTAIYSGTEKWGAEVINMVKTIPVDVNSDVILNTYWIDVKRKQIRKIEMNTKSGGTYQVEIQYNELPYDLPAKLLVAFDVKGMNLPKTSTGEMVNKEPPGKDKKGNNKGKVTITYSGYKVNTGLSDSIFEEKKKK